MTNLNANVKFFFRYLKKNYYLNLEPTNKRLILEHHALFLAKRKGYDILRTKLNYLLTFEGIYVYLF